MTRCFLYGCDRPGLIAAAAARGIALALVPVIPDGFAGGLVRGGAPAGVPVVRLVEDEAAVIAALDAGAGDAVEWRESDALIAARLAALLARTPRTLRVGPLELELIERRASRDGRALGLLPREFTLLHYLARHVGRVVTRGALREALWGLAFDPGTNRIEVHVSRLRAKLDRGTRPMLHTEKGCGYRLDLPDAPA